MADVYLICAAVGGTIFVVQLLLSAFGLGHHDFAGGGGSHDFSADAHGSGGGHEHGNHENQDSYFLGLLSFRAIVAAVTFFGLAGIAANRNGILGLAAGAIAAGTGFVAMCGVAWSMRVLNRLESDGAAHIEQSIGANGSVYLTVPGQKSGAGKIQVAVQGRTMEYLAVTAGAALQMGSKIVIVDVVGLDTVEVEAIPAAENDSALNEPKEQGRQGERSRGSAR
jgi:hypothetical protein